MEPLILRHDCDQGESRGCRAESLEVRQWLITAMMDVDAVTATQSHD
jgi:hypothetical protein